MTHTVERAGLRVSDALAVFVEERVLPDLNIAPARFWRGAAALFADMAGENTALLHRRNDLQARINAWHDGNAGAARDPDAYTAFLRQIGYLEDEPAPFQIDPGRIDQELATLAGPQLVAPALNARFVLNAANARWYSLYDALYGGDALGEPPVAGGYDPARGARVRQYVKAFLDRIVPLAAGDHASVKRWRVCDGRLEPALAQPDAFVGYRGGSDAPSAILLRHHGLHIELVIDRASAIGASDPAGVCDVVVEAALSTIIDLEDSVAAVDAEDKVAGYENWLGLMRGDLEATFDKAGASVRRQLHADRVFTASDGGAVTLPGRSLLLVRNVGHLMTTPALLLPSGAQAPEGVLDAIMTCLIALYDVRGLGRFRNSRTGAIYVVKPKMHGPAEAAFTNRLFAAVETMLGLPASTVRIGLMDEERRTSVNLAACIAAIRERIFFVNTGFLDRTGDEIHTSMRAGPMVRKAEMKTSAWITAYEQRNVAIALSCGFSGRAQIGKGMWTATERMADMMAQKIAHPKAGATTAWTPSPTAAALHALHYHDVDVRRRQHDLAADAPAPIDALLTIPIAARRTYTPQEIASEVDNNVQSILGYVVRWIDQGIGCSKVQDIHDVHLMEDRATLRISSQHLANWLTHGVCTAEQVNDSLHRMAAKVDAQNKNDPHYQRLCANSGANLAMSAARALIFEGGAQPNGYTEPLLHAFRIRAKAPR